MSPSVSGRATRAAVVAQGAVYVSLGAVVAVLLPLLVAARAPDTKEQILGWVAALSSVVTAASLPVLGALSDRTPTPWGRRMPWVVGGGVVGGLAVTTLPLAPSVAALAVLWVVAQVALNAVDAGAAAVISDDVSPLRRGSVAAYLGVAMAVGSGIGVLVAGTTAADLRLATLLVGTVSAVGAVAFVALRGRGSAPLDEMPRHGRVRRGVLRDGVRSIAGDPALRRVFVSRVLLVLGLHGITSYQVYVLADHVGMTLGRAATIASLNAVLFLALVATGGLVVGRWSDAVGRRAPFLVVAALLIAFGTLAPAVSATVPAVALLVVLGGLGSGAFLTVQFAQSIDILPVRGHAGRDLGILGTATTAAQALAPLVALAVLSLDAGYVPVFAVGAGCAVAAALLQLPLDVRRRPRGARLAR